MEENNFVVQISGPEEPMPFPKPMLPRSNGFSGIGGIFKLLSWIPAILSALAVFVFAIVAQLLFKAITAPTEAITYGSVLTVFFFALVAALLVGLIVKVGAGRRNSFGNIPIQ